MPRAPKPSAPARAVPYPVRAQAAPAAVIPLQRQTLAGMTVDALRERILRGRFRAGEPLRQDALADELGVSRIPVREALRQLEAEGLVTFSPHRGAVVSTLSREEIAELFELRAEIETDLLRRAIPHLTREQLDRARDVLDAYERALRTGEVPAWGALNWQFHSTLFAPAGRTLTMGVAQKLHHHSDRYLRMQLALTHGESRANVEHRAILAAVRRKDVRRACQLLREHILGAGQALLGFLDEQQGTVAEASAASQAKRRAGRTR